MKRFEELGTIGDGGFGIVTKCRDKQTGDIVAIKKMKRRYTSFDECLQLKEVKSLRKIKHENVAKLLQVFRENDQLYLVFEFCPDGSLLNMEQKKGTPFPEAEIRFIIWQLLNGLSYVHRQGFFHRDIKPENLLWSGDTLKIADFGLAREIRSRPPYTEYVATRWYRAPEIILRHEFYNSPVDMWAVGTIMAEMFLGRPMFQGKSETDQMFKIMSVLGAPTVANWPDGVKLANKLGIRLPQQGPVSLAAMMPKASPAAIELIESLLMYDPSKRPSAAQAMQHRFFSEGPKVAPNSGMKIPLENLVKTENEPPRQSESSRPMYSFNVVPKPAESAPVYAESKPGYKQSEPMFGEPRMSFRQSESKPSYKQSEPSYGEARPSFKQSDVKPSYQQSEPVSDDDLGTVGTKRFLGSVLGGLRDMRMDQAASEPPKHNSTPIRNGNNSRFQAFLGGLPQQQPRYAARGQVPSSMYRPPNRNVPKLDDDLFDDLF